MEKITYHVVQWHSDSIYRKTESVKEFKRESSAQKFADKLNATGGNYVVRSSNYML